LDKIEFEKLVERALETAKRSLQRDFGISPDQITLKQPSRPWAIKEIPVAVAAWQIAVPIDATPRSPKSRIKIEFVRVLRRRTSSGDVAPPAWAAYTCIAPCVALQTSNHVREGRIDLVVVPRKPVRTKASITVLAMSRMLPLLCQANTNAFHADPLQSFVPPAVGRRRSNAGGPK